MKRLESPLRRKVAFYVEDGFTTNLTVTEAMLEDIILAYEKDDKPIEKLRLVVPPGVELQMDSFDYSH